MIGLSFDLPRLERLSIGSHSAVDFAELELLRKEVLLFIGRIAVIKGDSNRNTGENFLLFSVYGGGGIS